MHNPALPYSHLALLTDLDGTLLTPEKTVSEEDLDAITEFRAKGGRFSVATGRGMQASRLYLDLLEPDYPAAMYNGALLYDYEKQEPFYAVHLPDGIDALLRELTEKFPKIGAEVLDKSGVYVIQDGEIERRHLELTNVPLVFRSLEDVHPEQCIKALFAGEADEINRLTEYVKDPRFSFVDFTRSHQWFLEILPLNTNKGSALRRLRSSLPEGTIIGAAGDFDNDLEMLREADFSGCPDDAEPCVKDVIAEKNGFCSLKTSENGFFAEWIGKFTEKYA